MTAVRLEELARKCSVAIDGVGRNASYGLSEQDLRDLARCARSWAKIEKVIRDEAGWSVDLWRMSKGHIRMLTKEQICDGPTALEAVEAAEVTDANKG